jgi:hypothetical protein
METAFDSHWKRLESWVGTKCLAFCSYYKREVCFSKYTQKIFNMQR